jgi:hypothetical protein
MNLTNFIVEYFGLPQVLQTEMSGNNRVGLSPSRVMIRNKLFIDNSTQKFLFSTDPRVNIIAAFFGK